MVSRDPEQGGQGGADEPGGPRHRDGERSPRARVCSGVGVGVGVGVRTESSDHPEVARHLPVPIGEHRREHRLRYPGGHPVAEQRRDHPDRR